MARGNAVQGATTALCKRQQGAQFPVVCSASTTCKCRGPVQHRSPQVMAPSNVPVPAGYFTSDDGQNCSVQTANCTFIQFLDGLRNVIGQFQVDNGQAVDFNYGASVQQPPSRGRRTLRQTMESATSSSRSQDIHVAYAILQGPGGSTTVRNPLYTTASYRQLNGKLNLCGGCTKPLLQPGFAFQDRTPCYCFGAPVNKTAGLKICGASCIVSPGNASCTQHS
jgi:hypothetical protein